jgi:hypothetical protein
VRETEEQQLIELHQHERHRPKHNQRAVPRAQRAGAPVCADLPPAPTCANGFCCWCSTIAATLSRKVRRRLLNSCKEAGKSHNRRIRGDGLGGCDHKEPYPCKQAQAKGGLSHRASQIIGTFMLERPYLERALRVGLVVGA